MAFAITTAVANIQAKHKGKIFSLWEMIKKFLLLKRSPFATPSPNPNASSKLSLPADLLSKLTEWWNQADLGYFDPYLNRAHGEGEIVLVEKNMYYRNIVLFIQRFQNLVTF